MKCLSESYDVVVCGGGLAGFCAAVASARHGAKTCLIQDRPVLGGNASSEIRVTVHGAAAFHAYARETGILRESLIEERARNHEEINENGWTNSVFDQVLYDLAQRTPLLTLRLNTSVYDVLLGDDDLSALGDLSARLPADTCCGLYHRQACAPRRKIAAVRARVANAETELILRAGTFIDCTGDGLVADLAGCEWSMGTESHEQTGELHAPSRASTDTMGSSIHLRARDIGRPAPFTPPCWAKTIPNGDFFHQRGRGLYDLRGGFWWIEIGMPWHTITDNETIRHELTAWALAIWDWIKNHDETTRDRATNYALEWIGQVPGKRESRRILGLHLLTEHDIQANVHHADEIAFGGWFVDLHTPGGLLAGNSEPAAEEGYRLDSDYAVKSYVGPYGVPLRSMIARDVDNLLLAGRCVSATHAALGTVRVMATTALVGQAVGTAAALARGKNIPLAHLPDHAGELQQRLLRDGCFLPHASNDDEHDLARTATTTASSTALNRGMAPDDPWVSGGLGRASEVRTWSLEKPAAQWIAVAGGRIDAIAPCLDNRSDRPQRVRARLVRPEHIWDYRRDLPVLAEAELLVPVGEQQWVEWKLGLTDVAAGYVRLDLESTDPVVSWCVAQGILPGQVAAWAMTSQRLRRLESGATLSFRIMPAQPVYEPAQIVSGVTRPYRATNLWRSDPVQSFPQWVQLAWPVPQTVACIELAWAGHLLRELHATPPFFRDPQCAADYSISALIEGDWRELVTEKQNYQRHRRHVLAAVVSTTQLRIVTHATHGDASAAIYEVRCYDSALGT